MFRKYGLLSDDFAILPRVARLLILTCLGVVSFPQKDAFATESATATSGMKCDFWHLPDGYDDGWVPEAFKPSCDRHRQCYGTADASWAKCNADFYIALRRGCEAMYPQAALTLSFEGIEDGGASGGGSLLACLQVADDFFAKVQTSNGLKQFQLLQAAIEDFESEPSQLPSSP